MLKIYKYRWGLVLSISLIALLLNGYLLKPKVLQLFLEIEQKNKLEKKLSSINKLITATKPIEQMPLKEIEALKQLLGPLDGLNISFHENKLYLSFQADWSGLINFLNLVENAQQGFLLKDFRCQIRQEKFVIEANIMLVNKRSITLDTVHVLAPRNPFDYTPVAMHLSLHSLPLTALHWVGYVVQNNNATAWFALPDHQLVTVHEHDHLSVEALEVFKMTATMIELKNAHKNIILHMG